MTHKRCLETGKASQWPGTAIAHQHNAQARREAVPEALRLAASIQKGTVTASLILRKLSAYPRQNDLALALRELGRIERTIFTIKWLQKPALSPPRRDPGSASGLNLVTAAIVLWNTVYLERAIAALSRRQQIDDALIASVAPLGWNHINLTGDYRWQGDKRVAKSQLRPLRRPLPSARRA